MSGRVLALSDLHVDFPQNRAWLEELDPEGADHREDVLIVAGDVCDDLGRLERTLALLRERFAEVLFVPGNHELWVRRRECAHSVEKFWCILELCERSGVRTGPLRVGAGAESVFVVPLFSWYLRPEEGDDGLYVPKPGDDPELPMWADNHFVRWPPLAEGIPAAHYFLRMNEKRVQDAYDAPVISFSHFLPRRELMYPPPAVMERARRQGWRDPLPEFNFSRVAGCLGLDAQIRRLGSTLHVYGHQHRNRSREIDGVHYLSHCLGYPRERDAGRAGGKLVPIWPRDAAPPGEPEVDA